MRIIVKTVLVVIFSIINPAAGFSQIPENLEKGFTEGNAEVVASHFSETVELSIKGSENVYSSVQTELILKDFFKKHTVKNFKIIHEGGQTESKYAIGNLVCEDVNYRVTIVFKTTDNKLFIHQLSIEEDDI